MQHSKSYLSIEVEDRHVIITPFNYDKTEQKVNPRKKHNFPLKEQGKKTK